MMGWDFMNEMVQNRNTIMTYLKHAVELEGNIYAAGRMCERLQERAVKLEIPGNIPDVTEPDVKEICSRWFQKSLKADMASFVLALIVGIATGSFLYIISIPIIVALCIVAVGFLNEYFPQRERYLIYGEKAKKERERMRSEGAAKRVLLQEVETIKERVMPSQKLLDSLYSMNVIYPKYRNFIAVAQLLEYFESGRRDTLGGVNGAYDLYEQERFQNMIIDRLDRISSQLGILQRTQNVLYQEINRTNTLVSGLENEIQNANLTLQGIQNTAAITAYNSMVLARETGARDYINYYR